MAIDAPAASLVTAESGVALHPQPECTGPAQPRCRWFLLSEQGTRWVSHRSLAHEIVKGLSDVINVVVADRHADHEVVHAIVHHLRHAG